MGRATICIIKGVGPLLPKLENETNKATFKYTLTAELYSVLLKHLSIPSVQQWNKIWQQSNINAPTEQCPVGRSFVRLPPFSPPIFIDFFFFFFLFFFPYVFLFIISLSLSLRVCLCVFSQQIK